MAKTRGRLAHVISIRGHLVDLLRQEEINVSCVENLVTGKEIVQMLGLTKSETTDNTNLTKILCKPGHEDEFMFR